MKPKQIIETLLLAYENSITNNDIRKVVDETLDDKQIILIINERPFSKLVILITDGSGKVLCLPNNSITLLSELF